MAPKWITYVWKSQRISIWLLESFFVLEEDSFEKKKKFAGVYMADAWDDYEDAERWKKITLRLALILIVLLE